MYRFADPVGGLFLTVLWVDEVEVDITVDGNTCFWNHNRAYRCISQRTTRSKSIILVTTVPLTRNEAQSEPNNDHVASKAFTDFTDKEVHIWAPHSDANDRDWNTRIPTSDGQKSSFGKQFKRRGIVVEVLRNQPGPRG